MGLDLKKPWNASQEISIVFFFKAKPLHLVDPHNCQILKTGDAYGIMGLAIQYNGEMTFNGCFSFFEIIFKPNGFYKIFRIPFDDIINQIIDGENIFDSSMKLFFEQLSFARDLYDMTVLANSFLFEIRKKHRSFEQNDAITVISNLIVKKAGIVNIDKLAYTSNMSCRSFERHFIKQVGIPPNCIAVSPGLIMQLPKNCKTQKRKGPPLGLSVAILTRCTW